MGVCQEKGVNGISRVLEVVEYLPEFTLVGVISNSILVNKASGVITRPKRPSSQDFLYFGF